MFPESAILNVLPVSVALLDANGIIVVINESWRQTPPETCLHGTDYPQGLDYVRACASLRGNHAEAGAAAAQGIRAVLTGESDRYRLDYSSRRSTSCRWFQLLATPCVAPGWRGTVVIHQDVTDCRATEIAARETQEQLFSIVNVAEDAIVSVDATQQIIFFNHGAEEIFGYRREEVLGQPLDLLLPRGSATAHRRQFGAFARTGIRAKKMAERREVAGRRKDGTQFPAEASISKLLLTDRTIFTAILRDVTKRKQSEEALRRSEERYALAVQGATDGLWDWNIADNEMYYAPRAKHLLGYSDEEIGNAFAEFESRLHPEDHGRVMAALQDHLKRRSPFDIEFRIEAKSGDYRWLRSRGQALWDEEDRPTRMAGAITDIDARKRIEREIAESQAHLAEVQRVAHLGSWDWNIEAGSLAWSDEVYRIFGLTPQQFAATYEAFLQTVHPQDREAVAQSVNQAVYGRKPYAIEHRILRQDGAERTVYERGEVTYDPAGKPLHMLGTVHDITEQRRLEEQLQHAIKMEGIGRLAGGIAHDFNNLLTAILGYTQMALVDMPPNTPYRDGFEQIEKAGQRAAELTRQLLAFARKQVIEPRVINLRDLTVNLDKLLRRVLGEDIELVTLMSSDVWNIKADAGQIEQVLMNLAVNARDAMPNGGRLTIAVDNSDLNEQYADPQGDLGIGPHVVVSVSDNGPGIEEAHLKHIFEPFFTTKPVGKGTGLGLATCYGIVTQSGGHIRVHSEPGRGTTFKLFFPRAEEAAQPVLESHALLTLQGTETILLVEDDPLVREVSVRALQVQGYTVLVAELPSEALALAECHPGEIHLLLTDVVMPQMSGRQVAEQVCALRPSVKVLYVSGYTERLTVNQDELAPGTFFLPKPFTPSSLGRKVRELLNTPSS